MGKCKGGKKPAGKKAPTLKQDHSVHGDEYDVGLTTRGGGNYVAGFDDGDFM